MPHELDDRLVVSFDIAADADEVWAHLREPDKIRRWFGWDHADLEAEIDRIMVLGPSVAETSLADDPATVTLSDQVRSLTWKNGDVLAISRAEADPTAVRHARHSHVAPRGAERTHLVVTRRGHARVGPYDGVHDEIDEQWIAFAQQLRFALEVHPGEDRRTIRAGNLDAGEFDDPLLDRMGLHGLRGIPVGGHVEVLRPDGSLLGGTIWHKSVHQVGILTHGPTEALLIVHSTPAASHPPHGLVSALLSTYGVSDERFADIQRRWSGWWGGADAASGRASSHILVGRGVAAPDAATHHDHRRLGIRARH